MRVLALDTALDHCEAAVVDAATGAVVAAYGGPSAGDAEAIVEHAARALADAEACGAIDRVVVTVGPGSFTGVRVGLAYAKGFALGRGLPALGVTTLEALARTFGAPCVAMVDARHGAVYAAAFGDDFAPIGMARMAVADAVGLADDAGVPLVGVKAVAGAGIALGTIRPSALASAAAGDPAERPANARYLAAVDAVAQGHKALARA